MGGESDCHEGDKAADIVALRFSTSDTEGVGAGSGLERAFGFQGEEYLNKLIFGSGTMGVKGIGSKIESIGDAGSGDAGSEDGNV